MSVSTDLDEKNVKNIGIYGDHAHVAGDITFYQGVTNSFIEENLDDVRSDGFINPAHSQDIVQRVLSNRFLLLSGKDRMGKAALSRHISHMLLQANSDKLSVKRIRQNFDLIEVLDDLISEKTQNHIILGYDININEIQKNIDIFIRIAKQKSKFIIFTSELPISIPIDLQQFSVEVQVNYPYTSQNIEKLLEKYFQVENIDLNVELKENIHNISKRLLSPSVAIRLAESLLKETTLPAYNQWVERLNDLNDFHKKVNNWLSSLGKSERIFFLTLALFHDLPYHNFWMLYENVIDVLRKRDPTLIELDYYALEENREFVVSEPSIAFKHINDRNIILLQLLKLHRRSLLKILPFLKEKIYEFKNKEDWLMRRAIAEAVGCIGTVEREAVEYKDTLYSWAKHEIMSVRAAVGHAHRQMIKIHRQESEDDGDKAVLQIIDQLSLYLYENSKERETMEPRWTVAASLGIINNYVSESIFEQKVLPIFKNIYHDDHIEVRKAVVRSMRKIGLTRFQQIRPILATKAKDHKVVVQLEVAEALAQLSHSNESGVHQLLQEWLVGQDEDRLWIAFYTFYLSDFQEEGQLSILQQKICENPDLQIKINDILNKILSDSRKYENKFIDEKIVTLFDNIACHNDMAINKLLIVEVLSINIYKYQDIETDIVQKWIDSDEITLKELADIIYKKVISIEQEMQMKRLHLLKSSLNNQELLEDFANRLPEYKIDDFWNEVNSRREEQRILEVQRQKLVRILVGGGIAGLVAKIFFGTGFAIFIVIIICCAIMASNEKK